MRGPRCFMMAAALVGLTTPAAAQIGVLPNSPLPIVVHPAPLPATKLEGFRPEAGSILTAGFEGLGAIGRSRVFVEVRDLRDSKGNTAGGVTINLIEGPSRNERAFIDVDELPGVLGSLDTLLKISANPTQFKRFESRFVTRGNLSFVAYSNSTGAIEYALQVHEVPLATIQNIESVEMLRLRELLDQALQKLNIAGYRTAAPGPLSR